MAENSLPRVQLANGSQETAAGWRRKLAETLDRLQLLQSNWNSYAAKPVDPAVLSAAEDLLRRLSFLDLLMPTIVPTAEGGVQIEWHDRGVDLEIELLSPEKYRLSFDDLASGQEEDVEGQLSESAGIEPFLTKLKREG